MIDVIWRFFGRGRVFAGCGDSLYQQYVGFCWIFQFLFLWEAALVPGRSWGRMSSICGLRLSSTRGSSTRAVV
jgi:hypothetical protein